MPEGRGSIGKNIQKYQLKLEIANKPTNLLCMIEKVVEIELQPANVNGS
jgi:hypothetical protein